MTSTEFQIVKALLDIGPRLETLERLFISKLIKSKNRDLTTKGRRYLFRIFSLYRGQIAGYKNLNLARLYDIHGEDLHDIYKVLNELRRGTIYKTIPRIVWPYGEVRRLIKRKGSKVAVPYKFSSMQFLDSFVMKLSSLGMISERDGKWVLTTTGESFLVSYELGDDPTWVPPFTNDSQIDDPDLFEPTP
ncbi:MAG: hypothetical protein ABJH04_08220 [Cyclobacteriaceae bacterium]